MLFNLGYGASVFVAWTLQVISANVSTIATPSFSNASLKPHVLPTRYGVNEFPHITRALDFATGILKDVERLVNVVQQRNYNEVPTKISSKVPMCSRPADCTDIFLSEGRHRSGLYTIWPRSRVYKGPLEVVCDMEDDGGGWTVIQRRGNFDSLKDYFYKNWDSYKRGFGDLTKDFWIGNDNIFALTNQAQSTLKFVLVDWEGNETYALYDEFWIDDEAHKYAAHVNGYRGTAGDSFFNVDNAPFTTKDNDNDKHDSNCAVMFKGAWWYTSCHSSNLNGNYLKGPHETYADGVNWNNFRGHHYSLKDTYMKIRPKDFPERLLTRVVPQ